MHDLVVRGGTVVDGSGVPSFSADLAIDDGVITEVGNVENPSARRTIDCEGLLVTPGWVDIHTHYDGQATWDEVLAPTSKHGVTTVVMGNCGVGFAPVRPDRHEWLIGLMEGVEDIPGTALNEGIEWEWETFPEYLDALDNRRFTMDLGTQIPHGAVRGYVMGERGALNESASSDEISSMKSIVKEALTAGALGFSTSRTLAHRAIDGEPVPGTFASPDEIFGIAAALGDLGTGVFELAPAGSAGEDIDEPKREIEWMRRLSAAMRRPVTFAVVQVDPNPHVWAELLQESLDAVRGGSDLWPQVAGRATGLLSGHHTSYSIFDVIPTYRELKDRKLAPDDLFRALLDDAVRQPIVSWKAPNDSTAAFLEKTFRGTYLLGSPPDYEPAPKDSLEAVATRLGKSPLEVAYDAMAKDGGFGLLYVPILNYSSGSLEPTRNMLLHSRSVLGLADGGAHVGIICDASVPTFMLTHWTRDRTRGELLPIELVVKKQTYDTARLYGLGDRGVIAPGKVADLNVIDYGQLQLGLPRVVADLPAGGRRILQDADGYVATIKSGVTTFEGGEETGSRPGQLLRGAR